MPFDLARAEKVRNFISNLTHTTGKWNGVPFKLADWQWEKIIKPLYGTINEDGTRQYRSCLILLPRKNGKSELCSALALYHLFADGEQGGQIYSAAVDREQATLVFDVARDMVAANPVLKKRCRVIDSTKRIINKKTRTFYKAIPADAAGSMGFNSSLVIYDEVHEAANRKLFDALATSFGGREQPLFIIISTAGYDRNGILYERYEYAKKVLSGVVENKTLLPVIYEASEEADWTDEKTWYACNPALGDFRSFQDLQGLVNEAKEIPALENTVKRLYLNQWTSSETPWIDISAWNACQNGIDIGSLKGRTCYGGLDLSSTQDITAFVLVFPPENENEKYQVLTRFWLPKENIGKRRQLADWAKQSFISLTPGNVVDYDFVKHQIFQDADDFDLKEIAFDSWNATQIAIQLEEEGLTVVKFRQGFKSMSPAVKELEVKILSNQLVHNGNPVLSWMVSNVMIKLDPAGNVKIDKSKSTDKVDGVVALAMALDRAHREEAVPEYRISFI